ncbi:MAG TPA: GNAT family N-acetyltransferase [Verrucomicrobiae bacterium]|nr:GNAT family N-acetyltransferase [Verrucomicrobiae bacterium]
MIALHLDADLVSQIQATQFEYLRGRMNVMRDVRGDPNATVYYEAEHLRACIAPAIPNPIFNQVFVSGPAKPQDVERVLALFDQHGMAPRFEIGPGALSREIASCLARREFMHTQSDPILIQSTRELSRSPASDIQVSRVESGDALESFKDVYVRGWQTEERLASTLRSYIEHWPKLRGWTLCLASQDNVPIGVAVLFEHGDVAYLADAATAPEFRARGAQSALIHRRLLDSRRTAARLVFSRAEFGSTSQRNLERAGLVARFTVAIWTKG